MRTPWRWLKDWNLDRVRPYLVEGIKADGEYECEIVWSRREAEKRSDWPSDV